MHVYLPEVVVSALPIFCWTPLKETWRYMTRWIWAKPLTTDTTVCLDPSVLHADVITWNFERKNVVWYRGFLVQLIILFHHYFQWLSTSILPISIIIIWLAPWTGKTNIIKSRAVIGYPSVQDGAILPARDYSPCPTSKTHQKPCNKSFSDQFCLIKMAGYWPRSLLGVYGPRLRLSP